MLFMYIVYCICLSYNASLEKWAQTWPVPCKVVQEENEDQHLVSYKTLEEKEGYSATQATMNPNEPGSIPNGADKPPLPPPPNITTQPPKPEYYKAKEQTNQVKSINFKS